MHMDIRDMSVQDIRNGIWRCNYRLALGDYGLMRTEHRVREAMRDYQSELDNRQQTELDFK